MKRKYYRDLWEMRFKKMHESEDGMCSAYSELIKECDGLPKTAKVRNFIKQTIESIQVDEKRHVKLIEKMQTILENQVESVEEGERDEEY